MFHKKVFVPVTVLSVFKYLFLSIGILLILTVIGLIIYKQKTKTFQQKSLLKQLLPMKLRH